ncbi:DUF1801 domain-containing protein [Aliiglaciecola lipolytica]|uniref:YdhG-like domain-containing protein n=1 Tax=Aliiglaciecola lipolytica E3 TaxID=1127673 RepID=K6YDB7_9ALTE|nr:DUF1801 domain-containing protein [Aliiglaciecola lipolytica]GAC14643.1 hypothetical protein GLIP_2015 [Aliiglaciecola lipolytica E3]
MSSENKTQPTEADVIEFINQVENAQRREDALVLLDMFKDITGEQPVLWGSSIIGFGTYTYALASGKKQAFMRSGFSPRKQNLSVYVGAGMAEKPELMENLGKHKTSKACLYINKLADVDLAVLASIIKSDIAVMNLRYPE